MATLTPIADARKGQFAAKSAGFAVRKNGAVPITRIAWIATVLVALITALLLLLSGYTGYAGLGVAVAASAAINLL